LARAKPGAADSGEQHSKVTFGIFPVAHGKLNGHVDFADFY
jgi:hypothetical protein